MLATSPHILPTPGPQCFLEQSPLDHKGQDSARSVYDVIIILQHEPPDPHKQASSQAQLSPKERIIYNHDTAKVSLFFSPFPLPVLALTPTGEYGIDHPSICRGRLLFWFPCRMLSHPETTYLVHFCIELICKMTGVSDTITNVAQRRCRAARVPHLNRKWDNAFLSVKKHQQLPT